MTAIRWRAHVLVADMSPLTPDRFLVGLAVLTLLSQAAEEQGGRARAQSSPAGHGGAPAERWDWDDLD